MTPRTDAELVRRARAGDRGALAELVGRHGPALRRACRRALRDPDAADDATQEAVVTAMLSLARLREDARFGAWLVGIGLNVCRHALRDRRRDAPLPQDPAATALDPTADPVDLDAALDAARAAARIRAAIAALPAGQRAAVELFYLAGLTHAEAAEHLGVPPGAVKARLHKARRSLRQCLEPVWKEQFAMSDLVPVRAVDVRRAPGSGRLAVLLEEAGGGERGLTIWIGEPEAFAIASALEAVELPRPGPHHLMAALVGAAGTRVREVRVSRLAEAVFYADVVLADGTTVDARPSDGIALALVAGVPLLVSASVLERTAAEAGAYAAEHADVREATDDRRVLAAETRERLNRNAQELRRMTARARDA